MKKPKHAYRMFVLQCWMVGVNPKKVDGEKSGWFWEHTWTMRRESQFTFLMALYLRLSPKARREIFRFPPLYVDWDKCYKTAQGWVWQYGWKLKDTKP